MKKHIVFAFGRFNPIHKGHEKLADKVIAVAKLKKATARIYLSHTHNSKRDPLKYSHKIKFARAAFGRVVTTSRDKTIIEILKTLEKQQFTDVTLVVGSDRVSSFNSLITKYNGKEYNFNSINTVSAGERDPDAEGVSGVSASGLRNAAVKGDWMGFKWGCPSKLSDANCKAMYDAIRAGMGIKRA